MTGDELTRRAKLILKDLGLRSSGGILEEWMAQYVTEAITRLESGTADAALSDQCAATIVRLWELREAEKQRELTAGVSWFRRQGEQLDEAAAEEIQRAIELSTRDA